MSTHLPPGSPGLTSGRSPRPSGWSTPACRRTSSSAPAGKPASPRSGGAPLFSLEISKRTAYTSGLVGMRTADLLALVQPGQSLYALSTVGGGRFCPMGGGAPLLDDDRKVFAGVGVSGGTAEEDVAILE